MKRGFLWLSWSLLLLTAPLAGQTPRIRTEVDTTTVTVGDRINLLVSVDHPPASRVAWPDSLELGSFEVLDARALPPTQRGDTIRSALSLTLATFELGDLEIPSFPVEIVDSNGEGTTVSTNPFGIRVTSVGLDEGGDIRDVRGPLGIPIGLGRILLLVLVTLLIPILAYTLYRRLERQKGETPAPRPSLPSRPPHEVALDALARLEASPLLERGEIKEFYIEVSEILRRYVEGRFHVPALEMTTKDIVRGMQKARVDTSVFQDLQSFLEPCDMVKFAKFRPDAEAARSVLSQGRCLVERTIPEPEVSGEEVPLESTA